MTPPIATRSEDKISMMRLQLLELAGKSPNGRIKQSLLRKHAPFDFMGLTPEIRHMVYCEYFLDESSPPAPNCNFGGPFDHTVLFYVDKHVSAEAQLAFRQVYPINVMIDSAQDVQTKRLQTMRNIKIDVPNQALDVDWDAPAKRQGTLIHFLKAAAFTLTTLPMEKRNARMDMEILFDRFATEGHFQEQVSDFQAFKENHFHEHLYHALYFSAQVRHALSCFVCTVKSKVPKFKLRSNIASNLRWTRNILVSHRVDSQRVNFADHQKKKCGAVYGSGDLPQKLTIVYTRYAEDVEVSEIVVDADDDSLARAGGYVVEGYEASILFRWINFEDCSGVINAAV